VVERIFGVLKHRFRILLIAPEYDMTIQARIPPALCALHNFICRHDPSDIEDYIDNDNPSHLRANDPGFGTLAHDAMTAEQRWSAEDRREEIANSMWISYQHVIRERGEAEAVEHLE
jgi:hypothetical protein